MWTFEEKGLYGEGYISTFQEKGLYGEGYISNFQENWEGYISNFQEKGCGMLMDIIKLLYVDF